MHLSEENTLNEQAIDSGFFDAQGASLMHHTIKFTDLIYYVKY